MVSRTGLNRHSPDSSDCVFRIAPLIASSNGNSHSSRAKRARSCRSGARKRGIGDLGGLSQIFPDQCASRVRVRDDITCGCGGGFRAAVFLLLVASMRVQQSATPLQIVPGKTLRQVRFALSQPAPDAPPEARTCPVQPTVVLTLSLS